jgi:hypothetical protein
MVNNPKEILTAAVGLQVLFSEGQSLADLLHLDPLFLGFCDKSGT